MVQEKDQTLTRSPDRIEAAAHPKMKHAQLPIGRQWVGNCRHQSVDNLFVLDHEDKTERGRYTENMRSPRGCRRGAKAMIPKQPNLIEGLNVKIHRGCRKRCSYFGGSIKSVNTYPNLPILKEICM